MENVTSLKTKSETPKTPGGISKSLLTPCRRVGLSRNWRKSVASPFNSPLASSEAKQDNVETRKRKETREETPAEIENSENVGTPARKVDLPRRKKSKILLNSINKTAEDDCSQPKTQSKNTEEKSDQECLPRDIVMKAVISEASEVPYPVLPKATIQVSSKEDIVPDVSTPVCLKSKSKSKKKKSPKRNTIVKETENNKKHDSSKHTNEGIDIENENLESSNKQESADTEKRNFDKIETKNNNKESSPNNLTKECIVVIQKKIFKNQLNNKLIKNKNVDQPTSQALFNDSDSDDVPLNCINKPKNITVETITIDEDDDFTSKNTLKKTTSNKSLTEKSNVKTKMNAKESSANFKVHNQPSQSSIDDDDEFFEKKRTIVVRKTYDKVIKPLKAKSTGSITQKDIEDLKARIETKKKMLLAKSMTDTKELRELIKKWQKGCQDALMELMELMKNKCPEQNMEYAQILQTLKIPSNLVGYDSDNDCFVTPEDENIIFSHIKE